MSKEADLSSSLEAFVINHTPSWGIRLRFPDSPDEIIPLGDEQLCDIIHGGVNRFPPKNDLGSYAISSKKVRLDK